MCGWQFVYGAARSARRASARASAGGRRLLRDRRGDGVRGPLRAGAALRDRAARSRRRRLPDRAHAFPYVDYHPSLPYWVFLGPGGAQFNPPQVYWKDIGGGVDAVVDHTYQHNRPYGRPIVPLGQTYDGPSAADVLRFRQLRPPTARRRELVGLAATRLGGTGTRVAQPLAPLAAPVLDPGMATLTKGAKGDLVVWAQQHLNGAGQTITVNGRYDAAMTAAVTAYQAAMGLAQTGSIDTLTWQALLRSPAAVVDWAAANALSAAVSAGPPPPATATPGPGRRPRRRAWPPCRSWPRRRWRRRSASWSTR